MRKVLSNSAEDQLLTFIKRLCWPVCMDYTDLVMAREKRGGSNPPFTVTTSKRAAIHPKNAGFKIG